ncbi:MAG: 16S rRNA (cytosine(967)-C(5))-methyltransferase RsmB [Gammaproteobacteria bacterium]|nr:16S rRNA (cytosine(967)-C(5))-methyltransferase RsmB [Gammaproteobacteria bacterium]MDD9897141.1 16S rRNA (cytosine(967)-C(5))-methyltransferase RsmB [Gammaproteobacteria bacterium]MDD9958070.1 16S rRNA (cytosine(967)-C(5))-methyltransferase RsmB [Gammaproteobacteria bacterium]
MKNLRAVAASIIASLLNGNGSLSSHLSHHKSSSDYSLLQEICFGSCRWFHELSFFTDALLEKPLKQKDMEIRCLLIVGLYQLRQLSIPQHAVLNETVAATHDLNKPWAKALVNAILRNYLRQQEELEQALLQAAGSSRLSFPDWMSEQFATAWPEQWQELIRNSNQRPPMTLRVNRNKTRRDDYLVKLEQQGISASPGKLAESSIYLGKPMAVMDIPQFSEGVVSVQDEASQLVPALLHLEPGLRVLDACAAPGGKTCHILESEHLLTELVAVDLVSERTDRIHENLERLQLAAQIITADILNLDSWWDGKPFDRVLLDAPCSATGVIRRHPDIKLLRSADEVKRLASLQQAILLTLWSCLQPNGLLLYTTCSVLPVENDLQIQRFLETTDNAKYEGITADWGVECRYGRQLLTGAQDGPDGFFYSLLRKT